MNLWPFKQKLTNVQSKSPIPTNLSIEQMRIWNLAQEIVEWTESNNWGDDWVIGGIASKKGYDKLIKESDELRTKLQHIKKVAQDL